MEEETIKTKEMFYPTADRIIEYNILALTLIKAKKKDRPALLSHQKLYHLLEECKKTPGDVYDKAAYLLKHLIKGHVFASGNRRTAFIVTKEFVQQNKGKFKIVDTPLLSQIMLGIREGYYTDQEIKEWIKNGNIKEFKRFER